MIQRSLFLASLGGLCLLIQLGTGCSSSDDCDGCTIDGDCVPEGAQSPGDPCQVCAPDVAKDGYSVRACSDGIACNGMETCNGTTGACDPGEVVCPDDEFCDPAQDRCVVSCYFCSIDRTCFIDYQRNPENQCQVCISDEDRYGWTNNDGAVCDDGVFCNGSDVCQAGVCSLHDGDPCGDDGLFCNGTEHCDEQAGACVSSDDACGEGQSCDETTDACCQARDHLGCNLSGDVVWIDDCGQAGELVEDCPAAPQGGCVNAACICGPGWMGPGCAQCVVFVSTTGLDSNDGLAWSQAKATIPAAIASADASGCAVWVAEGTYPTTTTGDETDAFVLTPGLQFYGGFAGTETSVEQRDVAAHPTVLDGEFGDPASPMDNACEVVVAAAGTRVDGFTIRGSGTAMGCYWLHGGLTADSVDVTVEGCTFVKNGWGSIGMGAIALAGSAEAHIRNTLFKENEGRAGGLLVMSSARAVVTDCVFSQNAGRPTAALEAQDWSELVVTRCRFEENFTQSSNIVVISDTAEAVFTSCAFTDNTGTWGATLAAYGASTVLNNCLFAGNEGYYAGAIIYGGSGSAILQNCTVVANNGDETGGIKAQGNLFIMRNSVVWGNTSNAATVAESQLLHPVNTLPSVRYSDLQGSTVFPGVGNLNLDPQLVNGDPGAGTLDLHLTAASPCIDNGSTGTLLPDAADLDEDGDLQEPTPLDLDGAPRVAGNSADMGAYETP